MLATARLKPKGWAALSVQNSKWGTAPTKIRPEAPKKVLAMFAQVLKLRDPVDYADYAAPEVNAKATACGQGHPRGPVPQKKAPSAIAPYQKTPSHLLARNDAQTDSLVLYICKWAHGCFGKRHIIIKRRNNEPEAGLMNDDAAP